MASLSPELLLERLLSGIAQMPAIEAARYITTAVNQLRQLQKTIEDRELELSPVRLCLAAERPPTRKQLAAQVAISVYNGLIMPNGKHFGDLCYQELQAWESKHAFWAALIRRVRQHCVPNSIRDRVCDLVNERTLKRFVHEAKAEVGL